MTSESPAEATVAELEKTFGLRPEPGEPYTLPQRMGLLTRPIIRPYDDDQVFVYFAFRTLSSDFVGERSDLHDLITLGIAAGARGKGLCCEMVDEANPAIPELGEIYGRYLIPVQPLGPLFLSSAREQMEWVLLTMWRAEATVWKAVGQPGPDGAQDFNGFGSPDWVKRVRTAVRQMGDALTYDRKNPTWSYFHSLRTRLTIASSRPLAHLVRQAASCQDIASRVTTSDGLFVNEGSLRNFVSRSKVERAQRILERVDAQIELEELEPAIILLENRLLAANETHVVSIPAESGRDSFIQARRQLAVRHREEARVLSDPRPFSWVDRVPAERFEALIRDLLAGSGKVAWIRSAGPTRDRDQGRDLVADWLITEPSGSVPEGSPPASTLRMVVQCKVRSRTVGKSDVHDVRDTVERHRADGFFLAVSSQLSGDLVTFLDGLRERADAFVDWWTRPEIEDELRRNPDIANRYQDIVRPQST